MRGLTTIIAGYDEYLANNEKEHGRYETAHERVSRGAPPRTDEYILAITDKIWLDMPRLSCYKEAQ